MYTSKLSVDFNDKLITTTDIIYKKYDNDYDGVEVTFMNVPPIDEAYVRILAPDKLTSIIVEFIINEDRLGGFFKLPTMVKGTWFFEISVKHELGEETSGRYSYKVEDTIESTDNELIEYEDLYVKIINSHEELVGKVDDKLGTVDTVVESKISEVDTVVNTAIKSIPVMKTLITVYDCKTGEYVRKDTYVEDDDVVVGEQSMSVEQRVDSLKRTNDYQDSLIDVTLLSADEIYTLLDTLSTEGVSESINVSRINAYVAMISRGLKTIDEIPTRYRSEVERILSALIK